MLLWLQAFLIQVIQVFLIFPSGGESLTTATSRAESKFDLCQCLDVVDYLNSEGSPLSRKLVVGRAWTLQRNRRLKASAAHSLLCSGLASIWRAQQKKTYNHTLRLDEDRDGHVTTRHETAVLVYLVPRWERSMRTSENKRVLHSKPTEVGHQHLQRLWAFWNKNDWGTSLNVQQNPRGSLWMFSQLQEELNESHEDGSKASKMAKWEHTFDWTGYLRKLYCAAKLLALD